MEKMYNSNKFEIPFSKFEEISKLFLVDDPTLLHQWCCGHRLQLVVTVFLFCFVCVFFLIYGVFLNPICVYCNDSVFGTTFMLKNEKKEKKRMICQSNTSQMLLHS